MNLKYLHVNFGNLNEFILDSGKNIFLHPDNFMKESHGCGEDYAFGILRNVADLSSYSKEFLPFIKDPSSRYHLSHERVNFLDALRDSFPKNATVLEIGPGCGTITRWLGEQFSTVDALEKYVNRAEITRYRTKDLDNVNVYCGNLFNTIFDRKYDFITLINLFECSLLIEERNETSLQACMDFLTRIRAALKDEGILLIAIESDISEFNSSVRKDEYTEKMDEVSPVGTLKPNCVFNRNELISMLNQAGFHNYQVFHVFPDGKYTETMIPENPEVLGLRPQNWIRMAKYNNTGGQSSFMSGSSLQKSYDNPDLFLSSSHSFILLASQSHTANLTVPWLIKSIRNNIHLAPEFHHEITLVRDSRSQKPMDDYIVKRRRLPYAVKKTVSELFEFQLIDNRYVVGEMLIDLLKTALSKNNPEFELKAFLKRLHDQLLAGYSTGEKDTHGYPLVAGESIDFTFWNIIVDSHRRFHFIDRKWICKKPIPADYVLFRNLFYLNEKTSYTQNKNHNQSFIVRIIQSIYPDYSFSRLSEALTFESLFQSYASGMKKEFFLEKPVRYFLADALQKLKKA